MGIGCISYQKMAGAPMLRLEALAHTIPKK